MQNNEQKNDTAPDAAGCNCAVQIADIQARLEKLEREALTMENLTTRLPRSSLVEAITKKAL